jgi:hypothetical protein
VTVYSGQHPPHGSPALEGTAGTNPSHKAQRSGSNSSDEAQRFTRTEIVSAQLVGIRPRPFLVLLSSKTPGAILIESVEVSICEDDEPVFNIPVSASSVALKKAGDTQIFRLTHQQLAAISDHLEHGGTIKVTVRYLALEQSELKISIIEKHSHHKLRHLVATVALGLAGMAAIKYLSHSG